MSLSQEKQRRLQQYCERIETFRNAVHRLYSCRESIIRLQDQPQTRQAESATRLFFDLVGDSPRHDLLPLIVLARPIRRLLTKHGSDLDAIPLEKLLDIDRPHDQNWPIPAELDLLLDDLKIRIPGLAGPDKKEDETDNPEEKIIKFLRGRPGSTHTVIAKAIHKDKAHTRRLIKRLMDDERIFSRPGKGYFAYSG